MILCPCGCGVSFERKGKKRYATPACQKRHYMRAFRKTHGDTSRQDRYRRWRAANACGRCGMPVDRFKNCLKCRKYHAKKTLAYYHRQKAAA